VQVCIMFPTRVFKVRAVVIAKIDQLSLQVDY
jgi:hypothetical protein